MFSGLNSILNDAASNINNSYIHIDNVHTYINEKLITRKFVQINLVAIVLDNLEVFHRHNRTMIKHMEEMNARVDSVDSADKPGQSKAADYYICALTAQL